MQRFRQLLLVCSLLFALSCTVRQNGVPQTSVETDFISNPYFSGAEPISYKADFTIYGNELSGILVSKKTAAHAHRLALTTDFGNTLLDVTVADDTVKYNYITPDLDRKMVRNIIADLFKIMVKEQLPVTGNLKVEGKRLYSSQVQNYTVRIDLNAQKMPASMHVLKGKRPDFTIAFSKIQSRRAGNIQIHHERYKVDVTLNLLDN